MLQATILWVLVLSTSICARGSLLRTERLGQKFGIGQRTEDVYYVAKMLDKLKVFAEMSRQSGEQLVDSDQQQLLATAEKIDQRGRDAALLRASMSRNKESQAELEAATTELLEVYHTVAAMMGSHIVVPSCRHLVCGPRGECQLNAGRARCQCKPCFEGDGFVCKPARCPQDSYISARPMPGAPGPDHLKVGELRLALIEDYLVVAVSDEANRGFLVAGRVTGADVSWGPWRKFSGRGPAFGFSLTGFLNGRIMVAFRDQESGGSGFFVGGSLQDGRGTPAVDLQRPTLFLRDLSQALVLLPFASSRAVCLYAIGPAKQATGGAALVKVMHSGVLTVLGKYRFAHDSAIEHLTAIPLSPTSLVVGFRALRAADAPVAALSKELSAMWMEIVDDELVVDPHVIELEPQRAEMGERDLSLVSADLFAYSYQSLSERVTKLAIIHVDPQTHQMSVTAGSRVISKGETTYLNAVSLPSGSLTPTTFTYLQHADHNGMAEVCAISEAGQITSCKDVMWADSPLQKVSGVRLMDGRLAFVFTDMKGSLFYRLLGADEFLGQ